MGLQNDDHSGELSRAFAAGEDSNCEIDGSPPAKNRECFQRATSQSSTPLGMNSSRDISSENAERRMEARTSYQIYESEDIEMLQKLPSHKKSVDDQLFSRSSSVCGQRKDHKGLAKKNDGNFSCTRANDETKVVCCGRDEGNKGVSCGLGALNCSGLEVEEVDSRTIPGSPALHCVFEDRHVEPRKHSQFTEDIVHELSSSSSLKCRDEDEKVKSNKATELDEFHDHPLQSAPEDGVDESEEEDVKVCDICGDTGREDLLAVCSRCSDGAEHTYCMREMLDKVPEVDWLCEECKSNKELEARKQEHLKTPVSISNERSKPLGRASCVNKNPTCERSKMKNVCLNKQVPSKRSRDIIEAGPTAKKQAPESSISSPIASSPSRVAVLSKDNSFKNLEKMKGKPSNHVFTDTTESTGDSLENVRSPTTNSLHALVGSFVKSNSFSSSNSKRSMKVSDEVPQKQKQVIDAKDGPVKLIGKSLSFKGFGRSSGTEPKVIMLSPNCAPAQELKGQKQGRDRNSFERKNTIKLDHPFPGQMAANTSKRPSRGDTISNLSVSNSNDYKNAQSDGKLTTLSKHSSHLVHKSSDATASLGEFERLSSTNVSGCVSVNRTIISSEAKPSHVSLKDGPTLSSFRTADRSLVCANGAKADVLDNQSEKATDNSSGRCRQGVNAGSASGKHIGLPSDALVSRTKEVIHEGSQLKAAIEAAMQKKQDIFKKSRITEKPNELSMVNAQGNHVGDTLSNQARDAISEEGMDEGDVALHSHILNIGKQTSISSTTQFKVYSDDFVISSIRQLVLTVSAIPEQESVWQGEFEIHRSGKVSDMRGGFQAHLSSFASGKVLEVVQKFPQTIVLNEVPRRCAWPGKFKEIGAQEDNIALYFFAKDHESYTRSYKILLEYMMKHDLALKGNVSGVELLVFPSNHLPDKLQCWNTLYYMWGVFRGRRPHCPDNSSGFLERPEISISGVVPIDKHVASVVRPLESPRLPRPVLEGSSNGNCNPRCSVGATCLTSQTTTADPGKRPENDSPGFGAEVCPESKSPASKDQDHCCEDPNTIEHQPSIHEIHRGNDLHKAKKPASDLMLDKQDIPKHCSEMQQVVKQEGSSVVSSEEQVPASVNNNIDQVKSEKILKQEEEIGDNIKNNRVQVKPENNTEHEENMDTVWKMGDGSKQESGYVDINMGDGLNQEGGYVDINVSADSTGEDLDGSTIKRIQGTDGSYNDQHRLPCSSFDDSFTTQTHGLFMSLNTSDDVRSTCANPRYFFLVDSHPDTSKNNQSGNEEEQLPDGSLPDLELALGVEKKQSRKGGFLPPLFADRKHLDSPPDVATSKQEEEEEEEDDASASLSLSLAFPFSDKETPPTNVAQAQSKSQAHAQSQALTGRHHDLSTSLLLFRGSSGK